MTKDGSIVITKTDKSRMTIIFVKSTYSNKTLELLDDNSSCKILAKDITPNIKCNLNIHSKFERTWIQLLLILLRN